VSTIVSSRLDLVLFTPELEQALCQRQRERAGRIAGCRLPADFFAQTDELEFLVWKRGQVDDDPSWAEWSMRYIVLRSENIAVGSTNFHGPPGVNDTGTPGAAEVGYNLLPAYRGLGIGTEVARAMLDWAEQAHGVTHFISGVQATNLPSLRVNEKLGFQLTGEVVEGELIFELFAAGAPHGDASSR